MTGGLAYQPAEETKPLFSKSSVDIASGSPVFDYTRFGARQHIENLHPANSRNGVRCGVVSFAQRIAGTEKPWQEWTIPTGGNAILEAERLLKQDNRSDIYVSQAAFQNWRSISQLTAIGACYVDLDYHNVSHWRGRKPNDVVSAVLYHLEEAMLPHPSYILATGRGLVCVWLTELLPRNALPRWNAVQKRLYEALAGYGSDRRALDAARVFRLSGSVNSRADSDQQTVRMVWCQGTPEAPVRHDFATLADEVLPITHAELVSLRAERAKRKAEGRDKSKPVMHLSFSSYYESVLTDLQRLRALRCPEGSLPEGERDAWLFVAGVAMSWLSPPEVRGRELKSLADEAAGWRDSETRSRMSAVIKRARKAAAGETITFGDRDVDCRYQMRASTIVDWLRIEPSEQRDAGLRVLVDEDRKRELNTIRTRESRHKRGASDREAQQAARLEMGGMALYLQATKGYRRDDLAEHFGVSTGQISKAMREAKARKS